LAFTPQHVAGPGVVQQRGGAVLGVQCVQGEHHGRGIVPGDPQILDQRWDHGDLVGLTGDLTLRQHHRAGSLCGMGAGGEQVRGGPVTIAGTAHGLPVDGHRMAAGHRVQRVRRVQLGGGPGRDDGLEGRRVDPAGHPADGGLTGRVNLPGERVRDTAQGQQQLLVRARGPLRGRRKGLEPRAGEAHDQDREHECGRVPAGSAWPRVGHRAQRGQQVTHTLAR